MKTIKTNLSLQKLIFKIKNQTLKTRIKKLKAKNFKHKNQKVETLNLNQKLKTKN